MSAGTTYKVEIDLTTKGDLPSATRKATSGFQSADAAAGKLMGTLRGVGAGIMAPLDAVASKVWDITSAAAKMAGAAGFGLAAYGVAKFNNELERTQISLGAIFNAQGGMPSIYAGLDRAGQVMAQMRKDAAALPGEFSDLMNIFSTIAVPGFQTGADIEQLRGLAAKAMATGATVGMPLDQVAREFAMLLEGRAGAHNVFGTRLAGLAGEAAEAFNKMSAPERLAKLTSELDRFAPAIEVYKTSFEGLSTTFLDNAKTFLGTATAPLFDTIKSELIGINKWFGANELTIKTTAQAIGSYLVEAFRVGKETILEWWPAIQEFSSNAYAKLVEVWKDLGPTIKSVAASVREFLKDPGSIDKIITALKLYAGLKIGGAVLGTGLQAGSGMVQAASAAKSLFGGGAAAVPAAEGAAGAAGAANWITGLMTAGPALANVAKSAVALAPILLWTAAAAAAVYAAFNQWQKLKKELENWGDAADNAARLDYVTRQAQSLGREFTATEYAAAEFQAMLRKTIDSGDTLGAAAMMAADSIHAMRKAADEFANKYGKKIVDDVLERQQIWLLGKLGWDGKGFNMPEAQVEKKATPLKHGGGGGGTTIQKVEIVVTSNQDPSRIAREVWRRAEDIRRHPRVSQAAINWSKP